MFVLSVINQSFVCSKSVKCHLNKGKLLAASRSSFRVQVSGVCWLSEDGTCILVKYLVEYHSNDDGISLKCQLHTAQTSVLYGSRVK